MKRMILAAAAVLSLGIGAANAQSFSHAAPQQNVNHPGLEGGGG